MKLRLAPYHNGWNVIYSSILEEYGFGKNISQTWVLMYKLRDIEFVLIEEIPPNIRHNPGSIRLHAFAGEYFYELHDEEFGWVDMSDDETSLRNVFARIHAAFDKFLDMSDDDLMALVMMDNL